MGDSVVGLSVVGASVVGNEVGANDDDGLRLSVGALDGRLLSVGALDAVGALDTEGELDGHSPNVVVSLVVNFPPLATTDTPSTLRL